MKSLGDVCYSLSYLSEDADSGNLKSSGRGECGRVSALGGSVGHVPQQPHFGADDANGGQHCQWR